MKKHFDKYDTKIEKASIPDWGKGGLILIVIIIGLIYFGQEDDNDPMAISSQNSQLKEYFDESDNEQKNTNVPLPSFELVDEETQDTPIKTQVEQHILVKDHIQPENLRALLNNQYDEINSRTGYQHRNRVTNAYIYIYDSPEKANRKGFTWIASLQKGHGDSPDIKIKEEQIEINKRKPESKFGFSESERKLIFRKLVEAQDKAREESIVREPDDWDKQLDIETDLQKKYESELAQEYGVDKSIIDSISIEGVTKQWPMPEL